MFNYFFVVVLIVFVLSFVVGIIFLVKVLGIEVLGLLFYVF